MKKIIQKKNQKGFTLIELIIVIAVIGILAAIMVPRFGNVTSSAKESALEAEAKNIMTALDVNQASNGMKDSVNYNNKTLTITINGEKSIFEDVTEFNSKKYGTEEQYFIITKNGLTRYVNGVGEISDEKFDESDK